jgi:hypothetical protein
MGGTSWNGVSTKELKDILFKEDILLTESNE